MPPASQMVHLKVCDCVRPHPHGPWKVGTNDMAGDGRAWVCLDDGGPIAHTADLHCPKCAASGMAIDKPEPEPRVDVHPLLESSRKALADFSRWGHAMTPTEATNALSGLLLSHMAILGAIDERLSRLEAENHGDGK